MNGSSKKKDIWPSTQDRTDNLKIPSCECVNTVTQFRTHEERQRFQKAKLAGNCCAFNCLNSVVIAGGTGYSISSTLTVNGGEPYDVPMLIKVLAIDASGGILNAAPVNPGVRYKSVPSAPYTTTVLTGPANANGATVSLITWSKCYPCRPY